MASFFPEISFDFNGIVFLIFCAAVLTQIIYLFLVQARLLFSKTPSVQDVRFPVSVILCARNEEDNLFKHLPIILEQDYPDFEVIVVNDQSVDDSRQILKAYQEKYPHLRYIELEKNRHRKFGKKVPLTLGIKGAKHEHLLLLDADCFPNSNQWIKGMMAQFVGEKSIVLGVGPYERSKGILNKMIRFDATQIAITYLGAAKLGLPYMGVGRNLAYTKSLFFEVGGFKKHYHIQSGDDDLFVQDAARRKNTGVALDAETFVYSIPKKTWRGWFKQKQRHYTTASKYRLINKLFLGIFPSSMIFMLISFFILLFNYKWWLFATALIVFRFLLYWIVNGLVLKKLKTKNLIGFYPVFELVHFVLMPFVYYSSERRDASKW